MPRVILVNRFYWPDVAATGQLLTDLAEDLAQRGWNVTVVAGRASYADGGTRSPLRETHNGVAIARVRTPGFRRGRLLGRAVDYLFFLCGALWRLLRLPRPDVVVVMTDPPFLIAGAALAQRFRRFQTVVWLQDVYPGLAARLGVLREEGLPFRLLQFAARRLHARASAVVALGPRMARYVRQTWRLTGAVHVIHNWSDTELVRPVPAAENPFLLEHDLQGKFVVLYSGNAGRAHGFDAVCEAVRRLADVADVRFVFIGGGAAWEQLQQVAAREAWQNTLFLDYLPREQLHFSLSAASVSLVTERPEVRGLLVPSKTYGILASGRPVLYVGPADSDVAQMLRETGAGVTVASADGDGLVAAIQRLRASPGAVEQMGQCGRAAALDRFDRRVSTAAWHDLLLGISEDTTTETQPAPLGARRLLNAMMPQRRTWGVLLAPIALAAALLVPVSGAAQTNVQPATVQAGDSLRVAVWLREEVSGQFAVGADSMIAHPIYREIRAAGLTGAQIEESIRELLARYGIESQLYVEPLLRVAVGGEVVTPRMFVLPLGTTVAQAVALAGGPTSRGRADHARLVRGASALPVDLTAPALGNAALPIHSGDQIVVPRRRAFLDMIGPLASVAAAAAALIGLLAR